MWRAIYNGSDFVKAGLLIIYYSQLRFNRAFCIHLLTTDICSVFIHDLENSTYAELEYEIM